MIEQQSDDASFYVILGDRIRIARKSAGLDQESFAQSLNFTRASIVNIEKGRQRPSVYVIWMMAQILKVNITDLVPPLDIKEQVDDWAEKIYNSAEFDDDEQKKRIIDFISATRMSKD